MAKLDFAKGVSAVLTGTANWAQLTEKSGPNKLSEKYQVELTLDKESQAVLESMKILSHLNIKRQDGTNKYDEPTVRLKSNNLPQLWDTSKTPFTGLIGNGSVLRVRAFIKSWEMAGKKGLTAYINKGIVLSLNDLGSTDDSDLWEDVDIKPLLSDEVPNVTIPTATAPAAFEEEDDLPF
jgi:hypothetical protein